MTPLPLDVAVIGDNTIDRYLDEPIWGSDWGGERAQCCSLTGNAWAMGGLLRRCLHGRERGYRSTSRRSAHCLHLWPDYIPRPDGPVGTWVDGLNLDRISGGSGK